MNKEWTYAQAGVDVSKIKRAHIQIGELIKKTFRFREGKFGEVLGKFGHYASTIDIGGGKALALHTDQVGTKLLIAQLMDKYDTVGIDCVAMCVNDLVCMGAEPVALLDYLSFEKQPDESFINEIMRGLIKGAEMAQIMIIGGETAVQPGVVTGAVLGKGFDLAAFTVGVVEKERIITGEKMRPGDVIIGLKSSGIHSNGLTLARKVLLEEAKLDVNSKPKELNGKSVGEELLKPTKIYVKEILEIINTVEVHGLAHITGGAYTKLKRLQEYADVGFKFENMPPPPPIFKLIKKFGNITHQEMFKTFNMGIGFCVIAHKRDLEKILGICKKHGTKAMKVGEVTKKPEIEILSACGEKVKL
jgi:phosphoribosylformylglycinamidine cyclo-ligase